MTGDNQEVKSVGLESQLIADQSLWETIEAIKEFTESTAENLRKSYRSLESTLNRLSSRIEQVSKQVQVEPEYIKELRKAHGSLETRFSSHAEKGNAQLEKITCQISELQTSLNRGDINPAKFEEALVRMKSQLEEYVQTLVTSQSSSQLLDINGKKSPDIACTIRSDPLNPIKLDETLVNKILVNFRYGFDRASAVHKNDDGTFHDYNLAISDANHQFYTSSTEYWRQELFSWNLGFFSRFLDFEDIKNHKKNINDLFADHLDYLRENIIDKNPDFYIMIFRKLALHNGLTTSVPSQEVSQNNTFDNILFYLFGNRVKDLNPYE